MKEKKLKSFGSFIMACFSAVAFFGIGYLYQYFVINIDNELLTMCLYFLIVFCIYYFHVIIHELGHLVFGLLTGYEFVSFRIGSFMIIKKEKMLLKKLSLAGTLGQCLMAPPSLKDKKIPYVLYNLGGSFFNLLVSIICLIIYAIIDELLIKLILFIAIIIGINTFLTNAIPIKMMINNDGYNALSLYKNPKSIYYFWIQLKVNELLSKDVSLLDMDETWFKISNDDDLKDSMIVVVAVMNCNRLMYSGNFKQSKECIEHLLSVESGIVDLHRYLLICDLIYCKLILGEFDVDKLLTKEQLKFMKMMHNYISVIRVEYAIACLYDKNIEKSKLLKNKFEKVSLTYPYGNELLMEKELIDLVDDKIKNVLK